MYILLWIIFGGIAGWIASLVTEQATNMGLVANIIVGIVGAFLGGILSDSFEWDGAEANYGGKTGWRHLLISLFWAVVGACFLLFLLRLIT